MFNKIQKRDIYVGVAGLVIGIISMLIYNNKTTLKNKITAIVQDTLKNIDND